VSSHRLEKCAEKHKYQRSTPIAREKPGRIGKKTEKTTCKPVEQEENYEKGLR